MSRSLGISALPIFGLLIVGTIVAGAREELIEQPHVEGERHITRQAEVLAESLRRNRNERFDTRPISHDFLHRLTMVEAPLPSTDDSETKLAMTDSSGIENKTVNSSTSVDKSEIKDMLETHVMPQDDNEDETGVSTTSEKTAITMPKGAETVADSSRSESKLTTVLPPPEIFPDDNRTADIRIATPEWQEKLDQSSYTTNGSNANSTSETTPVPILVVTIPSSSNNSAKVSSPVGSSTKTAPRTTAPTTVTLDTEMTERTTDEPTTTTFEPTPSSPSPAEMKLHEKKIRVPEPIPSGVTALIAAISFAMIVIVVYIGILVRKRYHEWRYGNRELLVNDFDAADISNFEL